MYGVYRNDTLVGVVEKVREDAIRVSADKEYYVEWLSALASSPMINKNRIEKLSVSKLLKNRLYKPFKSKRLIKAPTMKYNRVVKYAI